MKFYLKLKVFIQGNACQDVVCKLESILSQPQCVNMSVNDTKWVISWHDIDMVDGGAQLPTKIYF